MKISQILSISLFLVGLVLLVQGISLWMETSANTTDVEYPVALTESSASTTNAKILVAIGLTFCLNVIFVWRRVRMAARQRDGFPQDDEFSRQLKYRAAHWAFHQSFFVWMLIFFFRTSFDEAETMLGLGMLSMAGLFGLNLLILKGRGLTDEDAG